MNPFDITKPNSIWENYVPIKTEGRTVTAYLTDGIAEPAMYNELIDSINSAHPGDTIVLHLNTPGGVVDSGIAIRNAIRNTDATVIGKLSGTVASAGTMIALACDELEISPNLSFMCHEVSVAGIGGKFSDVKTMQNFYEKQFKALSNDVYTGFLTPEELVEMTDGKELWYDGAEVLAKWTAMHAISEVSNDE